MKQRRMLGRRKEGCGITTSREHDIMGISMKKSILLLFILLIPFLALAQTAEEYFNKGTTKAEKGDYRGAIQDYNKAIELKPNYTKAYNNRGYAKHDLGDQRGALQDFNKAIELNPNDARAYSNRGVIKIKLGQKDSGCLDLSKAGEMGYMKAYDVIKEFCQ